MKHHVVTYINTTPHRQFISFTANHVQYTYDCLNIYILINFDYSTNINIVIIIQNHHINIKCIFQKNFLSGCINMILCIIYLPLELKLEILCYIMHQHLYMIIFNIFHTFHRLTKKKSSYK